MLSDDKSIIIDNRILVKMSNYKEKLCKRQIENKKFDVIHEQEPKTIDVVYKEIIQNQKTAKKSSYKERMEKNMKKNMYLMEDLHHQLSGYWKEFGFFSKSSIHSFAKDLLPTIRVYHHHKIESKTFEDDEEGEAI